ncbi:hypothetical protein [Bacillus xiapuensis]|uniref:hypothetical protein n=1 Tax=Bacillus xiapuensis TaxID=2014075 RepID=UPI001E446B6C|nr:hypothetical protein [Bacillus xiapuensis]
MDEKKKDKRETDEGADQQAEHHAEDIKKEEERFAEDWQGLRDLNEAASEFFRIPVFFSHQNLFTLGPSRPPLSMRQQFVIRMFREIKRELLFPRTLPNTEEYPNTTLENIRTMIHSSYGLAAALLKPVRATPQGEPYSPFMQIEPSMGFQYGLPLLLVIEDGVQAGGIWGGAGPLAPFTPIVWFSGSVSVDEFFRSVPWRSALKNWAGQVRSGYSIQTAPEFKYRCTDS